MKRFYFASLILFGTIGLMAQPINDDCGMATQLTDVVKFCANFDAADYTYDAAGSDCGPSLSPPNMWFSFVAAGSILDLDVTTPSGGEAAMINLFAVDPSDPCNTLTNIFCTETGVINNLTGLTFGDTYYFSVSFTDNAGNSEDPTYELCITSGDAQANSDPCQSIALTPGICETNQSNILASPNINFEQLCPGAWTSQLWYTVDLNPGNHILDLTVVPSGTDPLTGDVLISIGNFEAGCMGGFAFLDFYCGPANTTYEFFGLNPDLSYYVVVATNQDFEGEFDLCSTESGEDPCVINDNSDDCGVGVPQINPVIPGGAVNSSPWICGNYCIDNASPVFDYSIFGTCGFDLNNSTVWFQVNTGPLAQLMNIDLEGTTLTFPGIAVFQGDCMNPTLVQCNAASGTDLVLSDIGVAPNSTYWVAVTSLDANSGNFELCINTLYPVTPCNNSFSLTEVSSSNDDSPVGGPYCPGEEVEFCFDVLSFDASTAGSGCQWFQAIVPSFGDGWDPSSFDAGTGEPVNVTRPQTLHNGQWNWYVDNDVVFAPNTPGLMDPNIYVVDAAHGLNLCAVSQTPNCSGTILASGVGLPGGWFAVSPDGNPPDNHPNNSYGDGAGCANASDGPWQVCFTLTTRSHPDCETLPSYNDCFVSCIGFPDGLTGSWSNPSCIGVIPDPISAFIDCSAVPDIQADNAEICSGQTFVITMTSPQDPLIYNFTVDAPTGISGASDGAGNVISQTLTNSTSSAIDVIYSVTGQKTSCPGLADVTVTVYPEIDVTPINQPVQGCALQTFALGNYIQVNGGKPPYFYEWSNGSSSSNPQVQVNADATFTVTVTDEVGCSGVGTVNLNIFDVFDVQIDGPTQICATDGFAVLTATPLGGNTPYMSYDWTLPDGTPMNDAGPTINADQTGTYLVTVKDAGDCPGTGEFEFIVNANPESNILAFPEGAICEGSTTQLFEDVLPGSSANITTQWIVPTLFYGDPTIPGFETDVPGDYTLIAIDDNGCSDTFTITLDVQPAPNATPTSLAICHDPSGVGVFDLSSIEGTINGGTAFEVDFFEDAGLTMQINALDEDAYASAPGTIYAVVFNDADCPSTTVEVTLQFLDEVISVDTSQSACIEANGWGTFNLTLLDDAVNGGTGLPVSYYENQDLITIISSPESFSGPAGNVYALVFDLAGCISDYATIALSTDTLLQAFPASLSACRTLDGTGTFDLTTQNATVTNGQVLDVIWYTNNTPPLDIIGDPTMYTSGDGTVYATVSDGQCIANVVGVDLSLTTDVTGNSITIDQCNRGDNTGRFDLTASDEAVGGVGNTVYWYTDNLATNAITDPSDFESGEVVVYAVVEEPGRCVSDPIPVTLNLEYLDITDLDSLKTCDPGNGIGTFDLTAQDDVVNGGTGWTVEWYEDAAGTIAITTPASYDSGNKDVYAIVRDGECVSEAIDVTLAVTNDLAGVVTTIPGCDQGGGMFNFDLTVADISISPDGLDVEYYTDNAVTNPVTDPLNYLSGDGVIYAVVRDGICRSPVIEITLDVEITVFPPEVTQVECDEGGGTGTFDLTAYEAQIAAAGSTVVWYEDAAATVVVANPSNLSTMPRDVWAIVTDANGCISEPTVFHLDTDNNLPAFAAASEACDDGFGMGVFNLDNLIATITGGNPFSVEFYTDAALTNQITTTDIYNSSVNTIYAITKDGPCESPPVEISLTLIPPIVAQATSDDLCDEGTGSATFDLTSLEADVDNGQGHQVLWYADASLMNPITDISNYVSSGGSVWAVLTNGNCDSEPVEVPLTITTVTGAAVPIDACNEGADLGTFNLEENNDAIVVQVGHTVTWYADAGLTDMIVNGDAYVSGGGTVYAVVSDGRCNSEPIAITLTLTDKLPADQASLADCDDGDGQLVFDLTSIEGIINSGGFAGVNWYADATGATALTDVDAYTSGSTTVYAQVVDGPCRSDIIPITLTVNALPSVDAGEPQQLDCRSDFIDVTGSGPTGDYTYSWSTVDGNIVSGADALTVRLDEPGTYTLRITDNATSCFQEDNVVISEDVNIPVADAGPDTDISCVDEATEIGSTATTTGADIRITWTRDGNPLNLSSPVITATEPGTYIVTVENTTTGCSNDDEVVVISTIADLTDLQLDVNNPNCNGANTGCIEMLSVTGGEGPYGISIDGTNFQTTTEICNLGAGTYVFIVRDVNGCALSQEVMIEQPEVLSVQIVGNNIIDYRDSTSLAAVHSPSDVVINTYTWTSDNHFNTSIDSIVEVTGLAEFPVSVTIVDENGCVATNQIIVYVRKDFTVFAPNAFSPNKADNVNDKFFLMGDEEIVTNIDFIRIYSRWGEKLYERENLTINDDRDGWDGTFEGERMLPGTYPYIAQVSFVDGTVEQIQGEVIIVD